MTVDFHLLQQSSWGRKDVKKFVVDHAHRLQFHLRSLLDGSQGGWLLSPPLRHPERHGQNTDSVVEQLHHTALN